MLVWICIWNSVKRNNAKIWGREIIFKLEAWKVINEWPSNVSSRPKLGTRLDPLPKSWNGSGGESKFNGPDNIRKWRFKPYRTPDWKTSFPHYYSDEKPINHHQPQWIFAQLRILYLSRSDKLTSTQLKVIFASNFIVLISRTSHFVF